MIKAIYARFGQVFEMDCMSLDSAKDVLQGIEDSGNGYGIGVFDGYNDVFYSPDNMEIAGKDAADVQEQKLESLSQLGITPRKFEVYDQS